MAMYRGLSTFITDIRNCKTKESEQERVDKELANVRKAFTSGAMSPYDRKKYVWKLVYINMLGYDVDFGHVEMISLVSSPTYAEKLVGYLSVAVMLRNTDEQITLVVQAIKTDLSSTQDPIQCLALAAIANIGGKGLAETVAPDVQRILFSRAIFPVVRKKAALCLLRLVRISRDVMPAEEWSKRLVGLLEDKNMGVVLSVVTLLLGCAEKDPAAYESCTGQLLVWLTRLSINKAAPEDYVYHGTPCPWLQVRILRLLQCFPIPAVEAMRTRLTEILLNIFNHTEVTKSVNRNNAEHCILFEAVNLIIKQGDASEPVLRAKAVAHLSKFINIREPNIRYLGLEAMSRLVNLEGMGDAIRKQQATIMFSLKDADISIRRRALDLLFAACDRSIAEKVVAELLSYLAIAEFTIKDEMVLKMAILAERFAPDPRWYVDTILQLITLAGDFVNDDIWHRVVQVVTNSEELQKYAASKLYHALQPISAHETAVKVGGYILGEYGYLLTTTEGDMDGSAVSGAQLFASLHQHFPRCGVTTKCLLLSAYAKLLNLYPELRTLVVPIFEAHTSVMDTELQQRAVEYLQLPNLSAETLVAVLEGMPPFPERASLLEARLKKAGEEAKDKDVWGEGEDPSAVADEGDAEESAAAETAAALRATSAISSSSSGGGGGGGSDDLLGLTTAPIVLDAASTPVTTKLTIEAGSDAAVTVEKNWKKASTMGKGLLYQDEAVQVGCKVFFAGAETRYEIFVGNRAGVPLVLFKMRVISSPALKAAITGEVASTVGVGEQLKIGISTASMAPFVDPPALQISFISKAGTGHILPLTLPAPLHAYCEPAPMGGDDFKARWGAFGSNAGNATGAFTPSSGSDVVTLESARAALAQVRMESIEANAPGGIGSSSFKTQTIGSSGSPMSVACLAMIIPAAPIFKVAVRTQHADVSKAIMASISSILEAM